MSNIRKYKRLYKLRILLLFSIVSLDIMFILIQPLLYLPYELYFIKIFDLITILVLFIDLLISYRQTKDNIIVFIKNHVFDILVMIPFGTIYLRLFAILRLIKLIQLYLFNDSYKIKGARRRFIRENILIIFTVFTLVYFTVMVLFLACFDPVFKNIFDGIWFNIVTMSSVGYGDLIPRAIIDKLITALSVLIGAFFISIFTSYLSAFYNQKPENEKRQFILDSIEHLNNNSDQLEKDFNKLDDKIALVEKDMELLNDSLSKLKKLNKK